MRVLIGGGSGFVGKYLNRLLTLKGHEAIILSRNAESGSITWQDLHKNGLPSNIDAVVNLSGHNLMDWSKRFNPAFQETLRSSRIDTTATLAKLINEAEKPPSVFVCSSAIGIYPASETTEYTEDDSPLSVDSSDFLSKLVFDWEKAGQLASGTKCRHVTVRNGLVLGRGGGTIYQLIWPFWFGLGGPISSGKQWFPWIHVHDVAGIFEHSIVNNNVTGVLNAVAPCKNTNSEFTQAFAGALYRPAIFPLPAFVLNAVFGNERAKAMVEGQCVIPKRTLESGYSFMYSDLDSATKQFAALSLPASKDDPPI